MNRSRSKYGVDITAKGKAKRTYKGITYDSELELLFLKEVIEPGLISGEIKSYERQVTYEIQPGFTDYTGKKVLAVKYKSDFDILYRDGHKIVWDCKGNADATAILKRKLFKYRYPHIDYRWITRSLKYSETGWIDYDELQKIRRENKKKKSGA